MNQLKVISFNGQLVTSSTEVAGMVDRQHNELLKTIRGYIEILGEGDFAQSDFFIESTYRNSQNKVLPCYLVTRKGCDMIANKMTGQKGVLFTAEYVTRFEEMEKELQKPKVLTEKEQRIEMLKLSLELEEKTQQHDERITNLEENMRIDGGQEFHIRRKANHVVIESLGGKKAPAYEQLSRKAFSEFWREFKNHFGLPRYGDLPKKQFEDGLRFIGMWQPSTALRIEIENANNQQTIREVI
ncbi:phage regulatory protein [Ornithinibacillus sp. L9]|uniref:Phage regulatory protein n=1 Tax=Ornithinibacillus caprae TaxID=2678566 RepID=A0A6N8FMY5_9BACI|nr:ORF6C domain-containing protein [Ornithinibacillus caprae]MUK89119.1 phage regulatory protein [Ornithinibacillus caprae]